MSIPMQFTALLVLFYLTSFTKERGIVNIYLFGKEYRRCLHCSFFFIYYYTSAETQMEILLEEKRWHFMRGICKSEEGKK